LFLDRVTVYLPVLPGLLIGAYRGWIVINLVSSLLAAYLIYSTATHFTSRAYARLAAFVYLWLPITFWQTTQPLAEAAIAPGVALAVHLYATGSQSYVRWVLLMGVAALLLYARHTFMLLLVVIPIAYLFPIRSLKPGHVLGVVGLVVLAMGFMVAGPVLFPPYHDFSYVESFNGTAPKGLHNMWHFFTPPPNALDLSTLLSKLSRALSVQFTLADAVGPLFFWPFNLLMLAPVLLLFKSKRRIPSPVVIAGLFFIVLHFLTIVGYQNQFRYSLLATPPLLVALGVLVSRIRALQATRAIRIATVVVVLLLLPLDATLAWKSRTEGIRQRHVQDTMLAVFQRQVPESSTVMVAYDGHHALLQGYVLRPRLVLYVDPHYSAERIERLRKRLDAQWLVARLDSPLLGQIEHQLVQEITGLVSPFDHLGLFRLFASD